MPNPAVTNGPNGFSMLPGFGWPFASVGPKFAPRGSARRPLRQGRGSNQISRSHALAELLEVEEEECLVFTVVQFRNADRSAQREPVVVPVQRVLDVPGAGPG